MSAGSDQAERGTRFFDQLFQEHHRALYAYLLGQTNRRESAEDLLQQVFVRVWRHIDEAMKMPVPKLKPWLFAIARNLASDDRRRASVRPLTVQAEASLSASNSAGPDDDLVLRDQMNKLERAINNLPEDMRVAFTMAVLGEMTSEEVAKALGRPAGTIRYLVSEARKRITREVEA